MKTMFLKNVKLLESQKNRILQKPVYVRKTTLTIMIMNVLQIKK